MSGGGAGRSARPGPARLPPPFGFSLPGRKNTGGETGGGAAPAAPAPHTLPPPPPSLYPTPLPAAVSPGKRARAGARTDSHPGGESAQRSHTRNPGARARARAGDGVGGRVGRGGGGREERERSRALRGVAAAAALRRGLRRRGVRVLPPSFNRPGQLCGPRSPPGDGGGGDGNFPLRRRAGSGRRAESGESPRTSRPPAPARPAGLRRFPPERCLRLLLSVASR